MNLAMTFRARVKNGRLTLDEPTDLPEGSEVDLQPVAPEHDDELARIEAWHDQLPPSERADFERAVAEAKALAAKT